MEKKHDQERVLAYQIATPITEEALAHVAGGAQNNCSARVVLTGDHTAPDVVIEI